MMMGKEASIQLFSILLWVSHFQQAFCSTHEEHKFEECKHILLYNFGTEHCTASSNYLPKYNKTECRKTPYCPPNLNVTLIDYWPFSYIMRDQINDMLGKCCGDCAWNTNEVNPKKVLVSNSVYLNTSDIMYPVFGQKRFTNLHGHWYIPFMDVPPGLYIVRKKSTLEIVNEVLASIIELWPLLIILLILALLAGFVAWVIETWSNTEEFSRSFIVGLLDGFWWAYVSMTTVGYGDKSTKTIIGRLFSVVWILMGITIFSMLTASLTTIITSSNIQTSTDMLGKHIGCLGGRSYDVEVITRHGGILDILNITHAGDGITAMLKRVRETGEGFLVDEDTFYLYLADWHITDELEETLQNRIIRTKKTVGGDMTIGILVKSEAVYRYLKSFIEINWFPMDTCRLNFINYQVHTKKFKEPKGDKSIFSTDGGLFFPTLKVSCILLAIALVSGFSFETWKKWQQMRSRTELDSEPCTSENAQGAPTTTIHVASAPKDQF